MCPCHVRTRLRHNYLDHLRYFELSALICTFLFPLYDIVLKQNFNMQKQQDRRSSSPNAPCNYEKIQIHRSRSYVGRSKLLSSTQAPPIPPLHPVLTGTSKSTTLPRRFPRALSFQGLERVSQTSSLHIRPRTRSQTPDFDVRLPVDDGSATVKAAVKQSLSFEKFLLSPKEPLRLSTFLSKYGNLLPMRIRVQDGFCSNSTDLSMSQNECFNLHFVKHTRVVTMKDAVGLEEYSVPISSSVLFGLVYNPHNNEEEAINGYTFESVGDVIAAKAMPQAICATNYYNGSSLATSVEPGEVLLVRKTKRSFSSKILKVYSLKHQMKKQLSEKCTGRFSTNPKDVCMYISDMLEHSELIPFPQKVMLLPDIQMNVYMSDAIAKSPVVLEKLKGESSVIATSLYEDDYGSVPLMDISTGLNFEVEVVPLSPDDQRKLSENTIKIYQEFSLSRLEVYAEKASNRAHSLQSLLYKKVLSGKERNGMQLVSPPCLVQELPQPATVESESASTSEVSDLTETSLDSSTPQPYESPRPQAKDATASPAHDSRPSENLYYSIRKEENEEGENDYVEMKANGVWQPESYQRLEERLCNLEDEYRNVETKVAYLSEQLQQVLSRLDWLESIRDAPARSENDSKQEAATSNHFPVLSQEADTVEQNRKLLATLNCNQVRQIQRIQLLILLDELIKAFS